MDFFLTLPSAIVVFLLGSAIGSFLNVVVYRLPAKLSLLWPPSRCPQCLHPLKKRENVPVLGWLWLKGRCAHCRNPIPIRYPLVEAATGLLFVLVFLVCGWSSLTWGYWIFLSGLLVLSLIDADTMTLPNELTQSGLVAGLLFQGVLGWQSGGEVAVAIVFLMKGIVGAVLGIWLLDAISFFGRMAFGQEAMGAGDAKLMATIGAWLGWKLMLLAGFLGCAAGAFAGGAAIGLGWLTRRQHMPFGPFLALGAAIAALWGETIVSVYLRLFFPVT
ncbi:MAG: prepilin peptidase [Geitlerinemataceae cyanobacterium]